MTKAGGSGMEESDQEPSIVDGPPNDPLMVISTEDVVRSRTPNRVIMVSLGMTPLIRFVSLYSMGAASLLAILTLFYLVLSFLNGLQRRGKVEKPAIVLSESGISWALSTGKWKKFPWASVAKVDLKAVGVEGGRNHCLSVETVEGEPNSITIYGQLGKAVNFRRLAAQIANRVDPAALGFSLQEILKGPEYLSDRESSGSGVSHG